MSLGWLDALPFATTLHDFDTAAGSECAASDLDVLYVEWCTACASACIPLDSLDCRAGTFY